MTPLSLRNETPGDGPRCAATDCENPIVAAATGRPRDYCSGKCRIRAYHHRQASRAVAEVTMGSASSRGRHPDNAWLVQVTRAERSVIIAIGLRRPAADRLAEQLNDLFA